VAKGKGTAGTVRYRIRVLHYLPGVYTKYQPLVGGVYEADYRQPLRTSPGGTYSPICVINVRDKSICLRKGEYEILEEIS
jgi:hypothetical protein